LVIVPLVAVVVRTETLAAFFATGDLRPVLLAALAEAFALVFEVRVFRAFWARALPAVERLVAGFNRVDLATACLREEGRPPDWRDEREDNFFPPFSIELLMRESPHSKDER